VNVLLLTSHSIAEYDDLRMLTDLGYDVFSIGAYTDPVNPTDDKRPALPYAPQHEDLAALCHVQRERHADDDAGRVIDWAKADLHPGIVHWADVIIVHHFPEQWIVRQWEQIRRKRVIWRTCGQSSPDGSLERLMGQLDGLEIVRYSPKERILPMFAGQTALIRFGKYPDDYGPWTGTDAVVGNVTQHMAQRGTACGFDVWSRLTQNLPTRPAGPGSEALTNGIGPLSYPAMLDYLRSLRAYLYTGTHPASYTLGLMEAMLSGVPVVAPAWDTGDARLDGLYEARDILPRNPVREAIPSFLRALLEDDDFARSVSMETREAALDLFDVAVVGPQWQAVLG
jgi:hypothetical protein